MNRAEGLPNYSGGPVPELHRLPYSPCCLNERDGRAPHAILFPFPTLGQAAACVNAETVKAWPAQHGSVDRLTATSSGYPFSFNDALCHSNGVRHGLVEEITLLVERNPVGLGVASCVGGASHYDALPCFGVPSELEPRP